MSKQAKHTLKQQTMAYLFNQTHAVGTPVRYWSGIKEGDGKLSKTRSQADLMGGTAVVWLEGVSGCIALSHVEAVK